MADSASLVQTDIRDGVGWLTLDNPGERNTLTAAMVAGIVAAMDAFEADEEVGAVVVTGAGSAFCAGANLGNGANGVQINGGAGIQVIGNVISGNAAGVNVDNATNTRIAGNSIGLNALGTLAVANKSYGVRVGSGSGTTVGGKRD